MPAPPTADNELADLTSLPDSEEYKSDPSTGPALDSLLAEATGQKPEAEEEIKPKSKPEPEAKPAVEPPPETKPETKEVSAPAEKEATPPPKDTFDSVEVPPYTKPKTSEAFAQVKLLARERIAAGEKERDELRAKIAELESKPAPPSIDPDIEKELKELRSFREKLDVEAHPSFKTWDVSIAKNVDSIYAKLRAANVQEESIKKIKELGGPSEVDWEPLQEKIPAPIRRYIEGKLFENEDFAEKKRQAIDEAKKNSAEFLRTRSEEFSGKESKFTEEAKKEYAALTPELKWMTEKTAPATATPEEKAAAETHNKFVKDTRAVVEAVLTDTTPESRAILAIGYAQLQKVRADHVALVRASEKISADHKAEIDALNATIAERDAFIAKVKKSSKLPTTSAPDLGEVTKKKVDYSETASEALDRLHREVVAAQD